MACVSPSMAQATATSQDMYRRKFVILKHDHPFLHWDFLIEDGEALAAWRLLTSPETGAAISAVPLPPHRRHYLTWEGPVSNNRGHVEQLHAGCLELAEAWPEPPQWPGHTFRIIDCVLADQCTLTVDDDGAAHWEFS